jgi:hypothetical protein
LPLQGHVFGYRKNSRRIIRPQERTDCIPAAFNDETNTKQTLRARHEKAREIVEQLLLACADED